MAEFKELTKVVEAAEAELGALAPDDSRSRELSSRVRILRAQASKALAALAAEPGVAGGGTG